MKKIKLKKSTLIALIILAVFLVAFAIMLPIYLNSKKDIEKSYIEEKIVIKNGEETVGEYTIYELIELCSEKEFNAVYKPSGMTAVTNTYKGVEIKDILSALNIKLSGKTGLRCTAYDGVQKMYSISDVITDANLYVAYKVNGNLFKRGINAITYKNSEDGGPYVVIKASDSVSQNRLRMLVLIEVI